MGGSLTRYAAALIARETADGKLELIDGHLRAETTPDTVVPVLVGAGEFARRAMVAVRPRGRLAQAVHEMRPPRLSLDPSVQLAGDFLDRLTGGTQAAGLLDAASIMGDPTAERYKIWHPAAFP